MRISSSFWYSLSVSLVTAWSIECFVPQTPMHSVSTLRATTGDESVTMEAIAVLMDKFDKLEANLLANLEASKIETIDAMKAAIEASKIETIDAMEAAIEASKSETMDAMEASKSETMDAMAGIQKTLASNQKTLNRVDQRIGILVEEKARDKARIMFGESYLDHPDWRKRIQSQ